MVACGRSNSLSEQPFSSPYLGVYHASAAAYVILLGVFLAAHFWAGRWLELSALVLLIVGPAFYYPAAYFWHSCPEERSYVKLLADMWGPFWVAMSGLCTLLAVPGK